MSPLRTLLLAPCMVALLTTGCGQRQQPNTVADDGDSQPTNESRAGDDADGSTQEDSPMPQNDAEWRDALTPIQYQVLRQNGTERAGTGEYLHHDEDGVYRCAGCGNALYDSGTKFGHSAWPAFHDAIPGSVEQESVGGGAYEVHCAKCKGHLGHIFPDGPGPLGTRH